MSTASKRQRRSPEQLIADLEAKIESVKRRAERSKARKDPALRHISGAVRSVDKAMAATQDAATRKALDEARSSLSAVLSLNGVVAKAGGRGKLEPGARRASSGSVTPDRVLAYVMAHPGGRAEDIAAALGTDTKGLRPSLTKLKSSGRVKTSGVARATRYHVAAT